jgi:restriction system protein
LVEVYVGYREEKTLFSCYTIAVDFAVLVDFDVSSLETELELCRAELLARPVARYEIHPRRLEEVVASVFRDLGFDVELTSYSADGGIDVYVRNSFGGLHAVQVKRYQASITAEQIRAFVGALVLRGVPSGVYVTTSEFTPGATEEADVSGRHGIPVELVDSERLFDYLKLAQIRSSPRKSLSDYGLHPAALAPRVIWEEVTKG